MSEAPELPPRPYVPPVAHAVPAALVAEWAVLGGLLEGLPAAVLVLALAVLAALLAFALARRGACRPMLATVALVAAALVAGAASAGATLAAERACAATLSSLGVSRLELRAESDSTQGAYAWRCRAAAVLDGRLVGRVWLTTPEAASRGEVLRGVGSFSANADDEWGAATARRGLAGTVSLKLVTSTRSAEGAMGLLARLHDSAVSAIGADGGEERALLAGVVCGDRDALRSFGLEEAFAACGVAHLVAVSGGHLSIVSALLGAVLSRTGLRPAARMALLGVVTGLFVAFCGAPASAVRAWCMSLVAFGSGLAGRRPHALSSVSLVALAMCLCDAGCSGDAGFVLSVASVMGLCALSPYAAYLVDVVVPRPRLPARVPAAARRLLVAADRSARSSVAATLVAQLATLPITVPLFGRVSLVAVAANLVLGPLFAACVSVGFLAVCLSWAPVAGPLLLAASDLACALALAVVRALASLPVCSVAVSSDGMREWAVVLGASAALLVAWPRVSRRALLRAMGGALAAGLALLVRWRLLAPARVVVLDVGQGDAILVQDGPHALLVDCGPEGELAEALAREHVYHLDAVLLTHMHDDHYGGLAELAGTCAVDEVLVGEGVADDEPAEVASAIASAAGGRQTELRCGDELSVGGFRLRVVSPAGETDGSENGDSVQLALAYSAGGREMSALLTGDAESDELAGILEGGDVGRVDLLKVGHHGSAASLTAEQAAALGPALAVASAGEGNPYGHPSEECRRSLVACGSAFLCTMDVGDVRVEPAAGGVSVSCSGDGAAAARALAAVS